MAEDAGDIQSDAELRAGFWEHVGVLRTYLLLSAGVLIAVAVLSFSFADQVIVLLLQPLHGQQLIFLSPLEPFFFRIRISFYTALVAAFPFLLALLLHFISPALSKGKRRGLVLFAASATLLGAASLAITYFYFIPITLTALRGFAVTGTTLMLTADNYLSFCILELLVVFVILQIPVVTAALSYARVVNPYYLSRQRRWAIIGIVTALAIVTPTTDVVTLIVVSIPALLLWEVGLIISKLLYGKK